MTRKRTPLEWAVTLGTIALVIWLQSPAAHAWWETMKWKLNQREQLQRREEEVARAFNHVLYEAWEAVNFDPKEVAE